MSHSIHRSNLIFLSILSSIIGCIKTDGKIVSSSIKSGKPFEVQWIHADPPLREVDTVVVDSKKLSIRELDWGAVPRSTALDNASLSRFRQDLLDSGCFEVASPSTFVRAGTSFDEMIITCNDAKFEIQLSKDEFGAPSEQYRKRVEAISRLIEAIEKLRSTE